MSKRVCFFVQTKQQDIIEHVEFYKIDLQILQDLGFEVVHCFSYKKIPTNVDFYFVWWWTYAIFPLIKAKWYRKKTVITGTFNITTYQDKLDDFYRRPYYQRFLLKKSAQLSDASIVVSMYEKERVEKEITSGNVFYSPHVLDFRKYRNNVPSKKRQKYLFIISWLSKLNAHRKCIPEIIKAANILKEQGHNIPFLIAGRMEKDGEFLKDMVKEFQLDDQVRFLGLISEEEKISRLYECGIYLQPTMHEGFGVAMAEAMLCGAPVITSKVGAVPEVTGDHCVYVEGSRPERIAEAVLSVFNNYERYAKVAGKGKEHIENNFYYERRLNDLKKIFEMLGVLS